MTWGELMDELYGIVTSGTKLRLDYYPVSYTHLRAHETELDLVCRLLLEKKNHCRIHEIVHHRAQHIRE